jgi:hypothetical protein
MVNKVILLKERPNKGGYQKKKKLNKNFDAIYPSSHHIGKLN